MFLRGFLKPIFFQWVIDLVVISEWLLWSSKPCSARMFVGVPFLYRHLFSVIFKLRQAMDDPRKKMTDLIFYVLLFFRGRFMSYLSLFFWIYIRMHVVPFATCVQARVGADVGAAMHDVTIIIRCVQAIGSYLRPCNEKYVELEKV